MIKKIAVVDYGVGNISSIFGTLNRLGCDTYVGNNEKDLQNSDLVILPGVGTFPSAIKNLNKKKLILPIKKIAKKNKPILGICLGMQLLTNSSKELKFSQGLGLIPGKVLNLNSKKFNIGWSSISVKEKNMFSNFSKKYFYFQHQFRYFGPKSFIYSVSNTKEKIPCIIKNKNIVGVQFHPEKSQDNGLNFLNKIIQNI